MPEVTVIIGGRGFSVACQEGEEHYLTAAAALLDAEAESLAAQIGRLPEPRMLLMAGLMLADKTAGLDEELRALRARVAELESRPAERVEVPVVPQSALDALEELAARAESLAEAAEELAAPEAAPQA